VNSAMETREVVTVVVGGNCLRGTYHKSQNERGGFRTGLGEKNRTGVLFLNPGFQPRAASGDSAVYWAESLAKCGYPCFRMDLPGLGDSDGDVPDKMLDVVNAGGYAATVSALIKELAQRFSLSGIVIVGLCAGAVTALFAGAVSKECKGLVLMDPYFFLPQERTKIREELTHWSSWSRLGALASNLYYRFRYLRLLLTGNRPPKNANFSLLRVWKQLASAGMPILLLKAPAYRASGVKPRVGEFDYISYLQAHSGRASRVTIQFVEGTNHSFADRAGRAAVRRHTEQWLNACFPPIECETGAEQPVANSQS
jgi:pimeloyl-ACP methyl ester carboxylesterase